MNSVWSQAIISVSLVSLISLVGMFIVAVNESKLKKSRTSFFSFLVALAIGALLGDLLIHLLPEIYKTVGYNASFYVIGGFLAFMFIEKVLHWRHEHKPSSNKIEPVGYMNLIADSVHNFVDGALVAASYLVSFPVGLATTIAVVLHEFPQELGNYGILRIAGFSKKASLFLNFGSALLAILGAVVVLAGGIDIQSTGQIILAVTSGSFIYLIFLLYRKLESDMTVRQVFTTILAITIGVVIMWGITFLE